MHGTCIWRRPGADLCQVCWQVWFPVLFHGMLCRTGLRSPAMSSQLLTWGCQGYTMRCSSCGGLNTKTLKEKVVETSNNLEVLGRMFEKLGFNSSIQKNPNATGATSGYLDQRPFFPARWCLMAVQVKQNCLVQSSILTCLVMVAAMLALLLLHIFCECIIWCNMCNFSSLDFPATDSRIGKV